MRWWRPRRNPSGGGPGARPRPRSGSRAWPPRGRPGEPRPGARARVRTRPPTAAYRRGGPGEARLVVQSVKPPREAGWGEDSDATGGLELPAQVVAQRDQVDEVVRM